MTLIFLPCSVRRRQYMPGHPAKQVESNVRRVSHFNFNTGEFALKSGVELPVELRTIWVAIHRTAVQDKSAFAELLLSVTIIYISPSTKEQMPSLPGQRTNRLPTLQLLLSHVNPKPLCTRRHRECSFDFSVWMRFVFREIWTPERGFCLAVWEKAAVTDSGLQLGVKVKWSGRAGTRTLTPGLWIFCRPRSPNHLYS